MSTYFAPGVYIEEVPSGPQPIAPASTSVLAIIGSTRRGPVGVATRLSGWTDFQRIFDGNSGDGFTAEAVYGFFENDGPAAFVVRADPSIAGTWTVKDADGADSFTVTASSPGSWASDLVVSAAPDRTSGSAQLYRASVTAAGHAVRPGLGPRRQHRRRRERRPRAVPPGRDGGPRPGQRARRRRRSDPRATNRGRHTSQPDARHRRHRGHPGRRHPARPHRLRHQERRRPPGGAWRPHPCVVARNQRRQPRDRSHGRRGRGRGYGGARRAVHPARRAVPRHPLGAEQRRRAAERRHVGRDRWSRARERRPHHQPARVGQRRHRGHLGRGHDQRPALPRRPTGRRDLGRGAAVGRRVQRGTDVDEPDARAAQLGLQLHPGGHPAQPGPGGRAGDHVDPGCGRVRGRRRRVTHGDLRLGRARAEPGLGRARGPLPAAATRSAMSSGSPTPTSSRSRLSSRSAGTSTACPSPRPTRSRRRPARHSP